MILSQSLQEKHLSGENGNEPQKSYAPTTDNISWQMDYSGQVSRSHQISITTHV